MAKTGDGLFALKNLWTQAHQNIDYFLALVKQNPHPFLQALLHTQPSAFHVQRDGGLGVVLGDGMFVVNPHNNETSPVLRRFREAVGNQKAIEVSASSLISTGDGINSVISEMLRPNAEKMFFSNFPNAQLEDPKSNLYSAKIDAAKRSWWRQILSGALYPMGDGLESFLSYSVTELQNRFGEYRRDKTKNGIELLESNDHDAVYAWIEALISEGKITKQNFTLINFDEHSDTSQILGQARLGMWNWALRLRGALWAQALWWIMPGYSVEHPEKKVVAFRELVSELGLDNEAYDKISHVRLRELRELTGDVVLTFDFDFFASSGYPAPFESDIREKIKDIFTQLSASSARIVGINFNYSEPHPERAGDPNERKPDLLRFNHIHSELKQVIRRELLETAERLNQGDDLAGDGNGDKTQASWEKLIKTVASKLAGRQTGSYDTMRNGTQEEWQANIKSSFDRLDRGSVNHLLRKSFLEIILTYLNNDIPNASLFTSILPHDPSWLALINYYTGRHHFVTTDMAKELAQILTSIIQTHHTRNGKYPTILEVGAGYGDLGYALSKELPSEVPVVLTDSFAKGWPYDIASIAQRGVRQFPASTFSDDPDFRSQLNIPKDADVIVIASHLDTEAGVEETLLTQPHVNHLVLIHSVSGIGTNLTGDNKKPDPDVWNTTIISPNNDAWISWFVREREPSSDLQPPQRAMLEVSMLSRKTPVTPLVKGDGLQASPISIPASMIPAISSQKWIKNGFSERTVQKARRVWQAHGFSFHNPSLKLVAAGSASLKVIAELTAAGELPPETSLVGAILDEASSDDVVKALSLDMPMIWLRKTQDPHGRFSLRQVRKDLGPFTLIVSGTKLVQRDPAGHLPILSIQEIQAALKNPEATLLYSPNPHAQMLAAAVILRQA